MINGSSRNHFARLNADGSLDNFFNIRTGANATVRAVAVQPDSAALIGGDFTQVEGRPRNYIARIHGEITGIWQTDELRRQKPTPQDEARGGLWALEQGLWLIWVILWLLTESRGF